MSGPSLRNQDAHTSIHEAALHEAKSLNQLFHDCIANDDHQMALKVADIIVEHWESRTLKHAESEEEGLYKEAAEQDPSLVALTIELSRDHEIMRRIVGQIKERLVSGDVNRNIGHLIEALIYIDEIHNQDEMDKLLAKIEARKAV